VKADPGQIEQIIVNLVLNARDAMPMGGKLTIETANVDVDDATAPMCGVAPGRHVALTMRDTGIGMDEQTQSHIFEPFFTTKNQGLGTGLGLATVFGIVEQSGGHIRFHSESGRGATFQIYLPRVEEAVEAASPGAGLTDAPKGSEIVLLVEDEDMVRALARMILQENGYTVLECSKGDEALAISEHHQGPIHLMITDVVMPMMSGRELAERLAPLRPDMRVLYMSGYSDDAIVHYGVLEPGIAFLQKPFTGDTLIRKAQEVLDVPCKGKVAAA
jgi:two-component system cell cycle sensor histidine kinase/response regulator CckA